MSRPALLIDIQHPDNAAPLLLMSGSNFEVIRTEVTGDEIYGLRHNDKDYLLFPMDFRPLDAGLLSVLVPQGYEEWLLERTLDGARITFSAVHGSPFFPDMPEEYHSSSGVLRIDGTGRLTVLLDRREDSPSHGQHGASCGCGCGHEHGMDGPAPTGEGMPQGFSLHPHTATSALPEHSCRCGASVEDTGHDTEETALARDIRLGAEHVNRLLLAAQERGLVVSLELEQSGSSLPASLGIRVRHILKPL